MKTASTVQSLDRGLELLEAVAARADGMTLAAMAEFLEVSQPAVFNLANTLVARGYLSKSMKPVRYRLGRTVMDLTRSYLASGSQESRGSAMQALARELALGRGSVVWGEHLAGSFVFSMRVEGVPPLLQRSLQRIANPYSMATPLCLMAFLDTEARGLVEQVYPFWELGGDRWSGTVEFERFLAKAREEGFVFLDMHNNFRTAAPVFDAAGNVVGALGLNYPQSDSAPSGLLDELAQRVLETAQRLSQEA